MEVLKMKKQDIIDYFTENEHCLETYNKTDNLKITNDKIYCARCQELLAQFNYNSGLWEMV
jgi:hypothetical protein